MLFATFGGDEMRGWGEPGAGLDEFLADYPALKVWLVFDVVCVLLFIAYGLTYGIKFQHSSGKWLLLAFVPMFLPLFAVSEYKRFKRLGQKEN